MIKSKDIVGHAHGQKIHLDDDIENLTSYLKKNGFLALYDSIERIEVPGAGNMNFVLRVVPSESNSFVVKQARPWVEKFPDISAPVERMETEMRYYDSVNSYPELAIYSPIIMGFDQDNHILVMEDLGQSQDYTFIYKEGEHISSEEIEQCVSYLNDLQAIPHHRSYPRNIELRKLNHQHIFNLPFIANNGFNLDNIQEGLQTLSQKCCKDYDLISKVKKLGDLYLGAGETLLHGDFYPGSILKLDTGFKVIDPEFSFYGPGEWDISVFVAHLFLADHEELHIQNAFNAFNQTDHFEMSKFSGFVGTEILRRLVGLAQLPLELSLDQKSDLIDRSIEWIKSGKVDILS